MLKAILVDMDGTLIDTGAANEAAYLEACLRHGFKIDREAFHRASLGRSWSQFLPELTGIDDLERCREIAEVKRALYPAFFAQTRINANLLDWLKKTDRSIARALVTTASAAAVEGLLNFHGLQDIFDAVVTASDVKKVKPDPEAYMVATARLGVTADACLIIEDSDVGMRAASAFGAMALCVTW